MRVKKKEPTLPLDLDGPTATILDITSALEDGPPGGPPGAPITAESMFWRSRAACATVNPEMFFPDGGGGSIAMTREAKAVCSACPVAKECLNEAMAFPVQGVWGGTSEQERRLLRRRTSHQNVGVDRFRN